MRHCLLILASIVGVARAGVIPLSDIEQQEKLQEFAKLCESGRVPESGADVNGIQVYCKTSPERITRVNRHSKEVVFGGGKNHAVFVRPPSLEQTHEIVVKGRLEGDKKQVYIVPATVDNKYRIRVVPGRPKAEKPSIFYLQNGPSRGAVQRQEIDESFQSDAPIYGGASDYAAEAREGGKTNVHVVPGIVNNNYQIRVVTDRPIPEPNVLYLQNNPTHRREIPETYQNDALFDHAASNYAVLKTVAASEGVTENSVGYPVEGGNDAAVITREIGADVPNDRVRRGEQAPVILVVKNN